MFLGIGSYRERNPAEPNLARIDRTLGDTMSKITYEIVRHDGGWAYKVDETFSESFRTHDAAHKAAELAAREQAEPGEAAIISYEDKAGHWHNEKSAGNDRPEAEVEG
jgi:hypothetical protein